MHRFGVYFVGFIFGLFFCLLSFFFFVSLFCSLFWGFFCGFFLFVCVLFFNFFSPGIGPSKGGRGGKRDGKLRAPPASPGDGCPLPGARPPDPTPGRAPSQTERNFGGTARPRGPGPRPLGKAGPLPAARRAVFSRACRNRAAFPRPRVSARPFSRQKGLFAAPS